MKKIELDINNKEINFDEIHKLLTFKNDNNFYNTIFHEDCKKLISRMKKENIKIDCIITDPPYNISRKNNFKTINRNGIDFGEWDKNFDQLDWLDGISDIFGKNGSIIIFNDWKNLGKIANKLESEGFAIKDIIRWIKPNPMPRNTSRRYVTDYEFAIWAARGKWTFNNENPKGKYLKPEYTYSSPSGTNRIHPTQKPAELIENIIKIHTNEGDIIFDPFSGSGEISLRAYNLNRIFIASEINKKYVDLSKQRFKKIFTRPAFNHLGNKYRIIDDLIKYFPNKNIENFVDVFAGSGIVSISYAYAKQIYLNEYDKKLFQVLQLLLDCNKFVLLENIKSIIKEYGLPINKVVDYKTQYNKLKNDYNYGVNIDNKIFMLFVLVLYGFNQQIRFNNDNKFNVPAGKFCWNEYQEQKILNYLNVYQKRNVFLYNDDFEDFVNDICKNVKLKKTLFYFDPPYLLTNATYNNMWSEEEEDRLLNLLQKLINKNIKFCLSNQLISQGKINWKLLSFIKNNVNKINLFKINVTYKNSNYQRKNKYIYDDLEILIEAK